MKIKGRIENILPAGKDVLLILRSRDGNVVEEQHSQLVEKELDIELSVPKVKRSLRANAYMWQLCTSIALRIGTSKEDVYREHIRRSTPPTITALNEKGIAVLTDLLDSHGSGWFYELLESTDEQGYQTVAVYYGSSTFDTKTMSRLIDSIVEEAKELGIETATPEEQAKMISLWSTS